MKTIVAAILLAVASLSTIPIANVQAQPGVTVPIQVFYNELSPYGQWVQHPYYGSVWLPDVGPGFQPYVTDGYWVMTEYGNMWMSDYPWGWAAFHYGRWIFDNQFGGWAWVPGTEWGPAWVSWQSGGGYYGWAPLGPGMDFNVNINIPPSYWTYVPQQYLMYPNWYNYRVGYQRLGGLYNRMTIINNIYRYDNRAYVFGPQRAEIERYARRSVPVYRIDPMDRPGRPVISGNSIGVYRPRGGGYDNGYYGGNNNGNYNNGRTYNPNTRANGTYNPNNGNYDNGRTYNPDNSRSGRVYNQPYDNNNRNDGRYNSPAPNTNPYDNNNSRSGRQYNQPYDNTPRSNNTYNPPARTESRGDGSVSRPDFERSESRVRENSQASPRAVEPLNRDNTNSNTTNNSSRPESGRRGPR